MSTLFFSIPNQLNMKISSDRDLTFTDSEYLLLKGYVPGLIRLDSEPTHIDVLIQHTESDDKKMVQEEIRAQRDDGDTTVSRVQICDTWKGIFSADLYHLLYGIVRPQLLKKKLFPIHGACVGSFSNSYNGLSNAKSDQDGYVLMVGHSGAGKTSVVLKLLQDENASIKVFSGNKTVTSFTVNNASDTTLQAIAGTQTITIRGSDKEKWNGFASGEHVDYWDRYAFMLNTDKYATSTTVPIKAIVIVRLNDYVEESKKINPLSALHALYPHFLDVVNADIVMSVTENVFIGTPPEGTEKYLVSHLKSVLQNMPVYGLIGSSKFVAGEILRLLKIS